MRSARRSPRGRRARAGAWPPRLSLLLLLLVLERLPGRGEERLLERLGPVAPLQLVGRREVDQAPLVEDPDALGKRLRLVEIVRAEQDRGVVDPPHLADE